MSKDLDSRIIKLIYEVKEFEERNDPMGSSLDDSLEFLARYHEPMLNLLKESVYKRTNEGCPTCGHYYRNYKRKLSSNMVRFLISLVNKYENKQQYVHYRKLPFKGRDYNYLAHWGLAETYDMKTPKKNNSGWWCPTKLGIDFVNNLVTVPSYLVICCNQIVDVSKNQVNVIDALGIHFNYQELMQN